MYTVYTKGPKAGQPKTTRDRVLRFLIEGLKYEISGPVNVRRVKIFRPSHPNSFYFVGKNGGVRAGRNISNSVSMTAPIHANMKLWEKKTGRG